jgi:hypothetical protein
MTILRQVKNVSGPWHALLGLRGATGSLQGLSFAPISAKNCGKAREFSDHNPIHNTVNLAHPVFTVWGANTGRSALENGTCAACKLIHCLK